MSRQSVVRLTDRPDTTLDVCRERKTKNTTRTDGNWGSTPIATSELSLYENQYMFSWVPNM